MSAVLLLILLLSSSFLYLALKSNMFNMQIGKMFNFVHQLCDMCLSALWFWAGQLLASSSCWNDTVRLMKMNQDTKDVDYRTETMSQETGISAKSLWVHVLKQVSLPPSLRSARCVSSCWLTWWSRTATMPGGSTWRPSLRISTTLWASPTLTPSMRDLHCFWVEPALLISGAVHHRLFL